MRKRINIFVLACAAVLLASCRAHLPVSQETGKEDLANIIFISAGNRGSYDVSVQLDNDTKFTASTVKAKKSNRRGTQYTVKTGTRHLVIRKDGNVIYDKKLFLSSGETKEIQLP
ncbi:MAG: hypothetical protein NC344_10830 [Bacteroidales bacterium]|nr:hypothetical protein [Bacteroidales bacterium]MCM1148300.1 hypothetical protein [Bacteroidales bacterium]MCM1206504.1 hypothetical protein [Bacillota bacterium]MCM1510391.1 hypothetical protein [Clostridium sp.]